MMSFFLAFPQGEKLTGVKHLQIMSGVSRPLYWLTNYIFDFIVYLIVTILVMVILIAFDSGGIFGNGPAIGKLIKLKLNEKNNKYYFHCRSIKSPCAIIWISRLTIRLFVPL